MVEFEENLTPADLVVKKEVPAAAVQATFQDAVVNFIQLMKKVLKSPDDAEKPINFYE